MTKQVFLDANIVISAGKPPGGPEFQRVGDLVDAGLIRVLTTDLTITEVAKKHAENDFDAIKDIGRPHFREIVRRVTGIELPEMSKPQMKNKLRTDYKTATTEMFEKLKAHTLVIDDVKPSKVFETYVSGEGFFAGEGKKDQFSDAFIFECLKQTASQKDPLIIVSADGDFDHPVKEEQHFTLVKTLPELFKELGLEMKAPKVEEFLESHKEEIVAAADRELSDWGLIGDEEDAEIEETEVTGVEIGKVTAFKPIEEGGSILVVGRLTITANISYTHPNWDEAMYDSEEGRRIAFDDVSGETEVELNVDVSMLVLVDDEGTPSQIEELTFRNSDFQFVELHPQKHDYM